MFDAFLPADCTKDVAHKAIFSSLVVLDKLHAVIGQHRMNFIGNCFDQSFEKASSHQFRRFTVDSGENNLRCPINRNKQKSFASLISQFSYIDVEIANLICFEPLRFYLIGFRQTRNAVPLQTAMQARARQMRDHILQSNINIIQWQQGLNPQRDDRSFLQR